MSIYLSAPGMVTPCRYAAVGQGQSEMSTPGSWFDPSIHLPGRKSRYLSRATRYFLAAFDQTRGAGAEILNALAPERKGIVVGTNFADYLVRHEFDELILAAGSNALNSVQAPNVSVNIPATQAAIAYQYKGVCATLTTSGVAAIEAILYASLAIKSGYVDAVVVGATEDNGSDDDKRIMLPDVVPGSCTLAAFGKPPALTSASKGWVWELVTWHWCRYRFIASHNHTQNAVLRARFDKAILEMLKPAPQTIALSCWHAGNDPGSYATVQSWLYSVLDKSRINVDVIEPYAIGGSSNIGCNPALIALQLAMQTANLPLLFLVTHPKGNVVALYLKPRFCQ